MPLNLTLQAVHLTITSKEGISAHQLSRILEVQYKSAWFLAHRIREAMRAGDLAPFGGEGTPVEVDETYFGKRQRVAKPKGGYAHKLGVLALLDRASGTMRTFTFDKLRCEELQPIVRANVAREARLMTDQSKSTAIIYLAAGKENARWPTTGRRMPLRGLVKFEAQRFQRSVVGFWIK